MRPVDNNDANNDDNDDCVDNQKYLLVYLLPIESRGALPTVFDLDLFLIFYDMQIKIYMPLSAYTYIDSKGSEIASDLLKLKEFSGFARDLHSW